MNYFVYELKRTLTADKAGTYTLGPALVTGTLSTASTGPATPTKRLVAVAPAVRVEVRDVPTPRPATYCGGIGNYHLAASATPTALRVGDPLTLTLDIERQAGERIAGLDLGSRPGCEPQLAADFEIVDRNPTGRTEGDVKRFEYALRPKRAGVSIPALAVSVFDPDTKNSRRSPPSPSRCPSRRRAGWARVTWSVRSAVPERRRSSRGRRAFSRT